MPLCLSLSASLSAGVLSNPNAKWDVLPWYRINHGDTHCSHRSGQANVEMVPDIQKTGAKHKTVSAFRFKALSYIAKGTELLFDYGDPADSWRAATPEGGGH